MAGGLHYSMAEESGNPKLDALIEKFKEWYGDFDGFMPGWHTLDDMKDPEHSTGACAEVSLKFEEFLRSQGVDAREGQSLPATYPEYGYHDNTITPEYPDHAATIVDLDGQTYMIDWTASQFGYGEWPMVQRMGPDESWERQWQSSFKREAIGDASGIYNPPQGSNPVLELKKWLDSFSTPAPATLHHDTYDAMQPQTRSPASQGYFVDPPSHPYKPFNWAEEGYEESPLDRTAGATRTQQLRRAQDLDQWYGPDKSETVHSYPNGWTMRRLQTYNDAAREGELMSNCFSPGATDNDHPIWDQHPESYHEAGPYGPEYRGMPDQFDGSMPIPAALYSLRDPDNLPHASYDDQTKEALGQHNSPLKDEYHNLVNEWRYGSTKMGCFECGIDHLPDDPCPELPEATEDYKETERNWYERAWSQPGSPTPWPNQPMHWRDDSARDVKFAREE